MTPTSSSYDWVREIKSDLKKLDSIPLTGATPPFPWEEFSNRLARSFDREGLTIQPGEMTWRAKEDLYEGLGDHPFPLTVSMPSLRGQVSWVMPAQEMASLAALLLTQESHPLTLHDPALTESFYHFLALEALYHFTEVPFDKTLFPILAQQTGLPQEDSLCWDIALQLQNHTIWGRLVISPEFRLSWVEHFAQKQEFTSHSQQMAQLVDAIVHVEAGKTQLTLAEWMSVQIGDFMMLDSCSLDSEHFNGRVMLTITGKPIFRAKLKDGTLKILELPLLHEVETPMAKQPENEDDDLSDLDLPDLEDEDLFADTNDIFTEENEETEETMTEARSQEEEAVEAAAEEPKHTAPAKDQGLISPHQIPVTLVVEVGQVQMTMEQILNLAPGNLLEINLHPQNGVDLTINGKVVGKGELIRIGEAFGVRVLQVGGRANSR